MSVNASIRRPTAVLAIAMAFCWSCSAKFLWAATPRGPATLSGPVFGEVRLIGKEPVAFSAANKTAMLALPLLLPTVLKPTELKLQLVEVRHDKLVASELLKRFAVEPKLIAEPGKPPMIGVSVNEIDKLLPGEYTLLLALSGPSDKAMSALTVTLERPAAQLMQPGKQTVDLWLAHGFGAAASAAPRKLILQPADQSSVAAVQTIKVFDGPFVGADGIAVAASLGAKSDGAKAGEPVELTLDPIGFMVGVTQGKLVLRSQDLKAPMAIEVEVRGRLLRYYIPLVVALGIALGYLLRVYLQGRADLANARLAGVAAIEDLRQQVKPVGDRDFNESVLSALNKVEAALNGGEATDIVEQVKAAKDVFKESMEVLKGHLDTATELQKRLRALPAGSDLLPPALQSAFGSLPEACEAANKKLVQKDGTGALAVLNEARDQMLGSLKPGWAQASAQQGELNVPALQAREFLDPLEIESRQLPTQDSMLTQVPSEPDFQNLVNIAIQLDVWRTVGVRRQELLRQRANYLRRDLSTLQSLVIERLVPNQPTLDDKLEQVSESVKGIAAALEEASGAAFAPVKMNPNIAHDALRELLTTLSEQHFSHDANLADKVRPLLAERRYFAALRAIPQSTKVVPQSSVSKSRADRRDDPADGLSYSPEVWSPVSDPKIAPPMIDPAALETIRTRTASDLAIAHFLQTIIVGAVVLGASWALFGERFIGTPVELFGLFCWGFATDLSVARLLEQVSGWAAKPKL